MPSQREFWVDCVRAAAAFMVVWLHSVAPWLHKYGDIAHSDWHLANIADSIVRVSVPLFFLLTGHLLLGRQVSLNNYVRKRVLRIAVPWAVWSIVYVLWNIYYNGAHISVLYGVKSFVDGSISYHLWFLYTLLGLYIVIPVLSWGIDVHNRSRAIYFTVVWFVAASMMPFLHRVVTHVTGRDVKVALDLTMFCGYSGYLMAGHLLGQLRITRGIVLASASALVCSVSFTALATFYVTSRSGAFVEYFYGYLSPNVVVASMAAFLLLKKCGLMLCNNVIVVRIVASLSAASLGVYLVHPIFLDLIRGGALGASLASVSNGTSFSVPAVASLVFGLSYTVVYAILRVPVIRRIV
jgi:surface polysaccharide O-acyltransferase-like enzyme